MNVSVGSGRSFYQYKSQKSGQILRTGPLDEENASRVQRLEPSVFCVADLDSRPGAAAERRLLLRLRGALQFVLRDLQPPHQPAGGRDSADVPASLLPDQRRRHRGGSVTEVPKSHVCTHPKTS